MHSSYFLSLLFAIFSSIAGAQQNTLPYKFHPPLGIPLELSSNFGSIRSNHFHMGLDFKTNMKTGYRIYAIEDGYVSRIKVSTSGYGKVIYIDHPNGLTSVYAHCSEFKGTIDSIVKLTQRSEQNYTVEIFPNKEEILVKKGEIIALSGNTGSSTGPHLHFEIRDTETEHALNPMLYGFDMPDSKSPEIKNIKIYAVDGSGYRYENMMITKPVIKEMSTFRLKDDAVEITSDFCSLNGGVGFAFDAVDLMDGSFNQFGVYGSHLVVDGDTIFSQILDRISFDNSRLVNTHTDYEAFKTLRKDYHKSFRTAINDLAIYKHEKNQGIVRIEPGKSYAVTYIVFDKKGNESRLQFNLFVSVGPIQERPNVSDGKHYLEPDRPYYFKSENCELNLPEKTVLEPQYYDEDRFCEQVFDAHQPVYQPYEIRLKNPYPNDGKSYIEVKGNTIKGQYLPTRVENDWLVAESKQFGTFQITRDEEIPRILPINILAKTNVLSRKKLLWNISDTGSGIADYDLFIDGEWHLIEYETKGNLLTFDIPSGFIGTKTLRLVISDNCGNTAEWTKSIEFM